MWLERFWFDDVDLVVFYVFCAVSAIITIIGIVSILLQCCLKGIKGISPGGSMDFYILIGGRLLVTTVLIRGISTSLASADILTGICQLYPAVLLIGLTMFFGGLFVKAATIYGYRWFRKPSTVPDEWKPNLAMWALLIVIGIASVIWCLLFTPTLTEMTSKTYRCFSEAEFEWKVATSAWHGFLLFLAFIMMPLQCKAARQTPCRSESNALAVAITNCVLSVTAGICLYYLLDSTVNIVYTIQGGLMLWMVLVSDVAMMAGKVSMARTLSRQTEAFEEDERYDVIKEDAVSGHSGEAMEMGVAPTQFVNKGYDEDDNPHVFNY